MPNKLNRNKRGGSRIPVKPGSKRFVPPDSVKDVLARGNPTLTRVADQVGLQRWWREWLTEHLPGELIPRLSGVVERGATLVIFTESAAWSARLRYVIQDLQAQIKEARPTIQQVSVRVMPKP